MTDKINKLEAVHSFTVEPKDCNHNMNQESNKNDILFGGKLLYELDFAGAKVVRRATYGVDKDYSVTASVDTVNFEKPAYIGDIVTYVASITKLGRSSIEVRVKVKREDTEGNIEHMCSANMTFVTIKNGKSIAHGLTFDILEGKSNDESN